MHGARINRETLTEMEEFLYLVFPLGMVPWREKRPESVRCHPGPNTRTLDAYQWDTTRHILVSDKSRRVPGADDVRDWN